MRRRRRGVSTTVRVAKHRETPAPADLLHSTHMLFGPRWSPLFANNWRWRAVPGAFDSGEDALAIERLHES